MSRKTERAYVSLFQKILEIEPEWQPEILIVDFERAAMVALRILFPNSRIQGCWFHSSQAVWKRVNSLGMFIIIILVVPRLFVHKICPLYISPFI